MRAPSLSGSLRLLALVASLAVSAVQAHGDKHNGHDARDAQAVAPQSARVTIADTLVLDQHGRTLRFKSDVLADGIVVIGFLYTSCTTVCPVTSQIMAQVQARLGARPDHRVGFVTVSVDPVRDRPAVLAAYAERIGAGADWRWLTGAKPQVDEVLKGFGAWTAKVVDHPPLIMVGDAKSGRWLRFFGFPDPEQLVAAVNELEAARTRRGGQG